MAKAASHDEVSDAIQQTTKFKRISGEIPPKFKKRWDDLLDIKFPDLGIAVEQFNEKQRYGTFAKVLARFRPIHDESV